MTFSDPGFGPILHYYTRVNIVEISCETKDVFPEPTLTLDLYFDVDYTTLGR